MNWLLCDYGEVLSLPQPSADRQAIESTAGHAGLDFWAAYWQHRPTYDRGDLTVERYWTAVLGSPPTPTLLHALVEVDTASWLHPNHLSLAAAARAEQRGLRLAILSNAPVEIAAAIDTRDWLAAFSPRLFSCHLRAVKPELAAYTAALDALGAHPSQVVFLDDRPANVATANKIGMRAKLFTDPTQIDTVVR